jgi:hypothetical protein
MSLQSDLQTHISIQNLRTLRWSWIEDSAVPTDRLSFSYATAQKASDLSDEGSRKLSDARWSPRRRETIDVGGIGHDDDDAPESRLGARVTTAASRQRRR